MKSRNYLSGNDSSQCGNSVFKYNAPPPDLHGDLGALALGSMVSAMFIFVKAELFLPIVGGIFIFSVLSSIIQRLFFKWMLHTRAGKSRTLSFFPQIPYHHHLQRLWTYNRNPSDVESVWLIFLKKLESIRFLKKINC